MGKCPRAQKHHLCLSLSCNLAQASHSAFINQERDSHSLLMAAVLGQRLWKTGTLFSLPLAQAHTVPCSLQAGQRQAQILSAKSRANAGKLRRQRSSRALSSRSTVPYTEFSFLALSVLKMCKTKRLLSVHPFDFELDSDYSAQSRRQSVQLSPAASSPDAFQVLGDSWGVPCLSSSSFLLPLLLQPQNLLQLVLGGNGVSP